jgi:glycine cleavage system H protein
MTQIGEFLIPEDLYYQVEKHLWARPLAGGELVRLGLTPVAYKLLNHTVVAISIRQKVLGQPVAKGASLAMVESLKYIGPLAAPFAGALVRGNERLTGDPDLAMADPYGAGWIVEMRPADWPAAQAELLTGDAALAAYRKLLEAQKIAWV